MREILALENGVYVCGMFTTWSLTKKRKENVPTAMRKIRRFFHFFFIWILSFGERNSKKKTVGFYVRYFWKIACIGIFAR